MEKQNQVQNVVVTPTKSVGISILLTLLFGPIGMFYSTVKGALLWFVLMLVVVALVFATEPALLFVAIPALWLVSLIWGAMAVKSYNQKLLQQGG